METNTISFNVSKTINIGNFEAIKINYGQSITLDPTKPVKYVLLVGQQILYHQALAMVACITVLIVI